MMHQLIIAMKKLTLIIFCALTWCLKSAYHFSLQIQCISSLIQFLWSVYCKLMSNILSLVINPPSRALWLHCSWYQHKYFILSTPVTSVIIQERNLVLCFHWWQSCTHIAEPRWEDSPAIVMEKCISLTPGMMYRVSFKSALVVIQGTLTAQHYVGSILSLHVLVLLRMNRVLVCLWTACIMLRISWGQQVPGSFPN